MNSFKADIEEIRRRAMEKMEDGAVAASYQADKDRVIEVLNEVLATETVCTRLIEEILAKEEEHADDMASLLARVK